MLRGPERWSTCWAVRLRNGRAKQGLMLSNLCAPFGRPMSVYNICNMLVSTCGICSRCFGGDEAPGLHRLDGCCRKWVVPRFPIPYSSFRVRIEYVKRHRKCPCSSVVHPRRQDSEHLAMEDRASETGPFCACREIPSVALQVT